MRKQNTILMLLFLLLNWNWAGAEEVSVKVASDRAAVVHVTDKQRPDPNTSGTLKGSADLKEGKSAFQGEFTLKNAAELKDSKAGVFGSLTSKTIELIGFMDMKLPQDPTAPKVLEVKGKTVTEGDQSAVDFNLDLVAPNKGGEVPTGSGTANLEGDLKAFKSSGDFTLSGGDIKGDELQFKMFNFSISEVEDAASKKTKTTVSFEMKVPKSSPMAKKLEQIPMMATMVEQQFKQANIQYEGLDFPAPTDEGDLKDGKAKLTIVDLRGTIRPFLGFAASNLQGEVGPNVDVQGALSNMLDVKLDNVNFTLNVDGDKMDGKFQGDLSSLDKFYDGYLVILPAIQKKSNQQMAREAGEFGPLLATLMDLNSEQAVKAIRAAVDSGLHLKGELKFDLQPKEQDKEKDVALTASGNLLTTNYEKYTAKCKELGLPVAEKVVGKLDISLKDRTNLTGQAYLYTDGELVSYYKTMLTEAVEKSGAGKDVVDAIGSLALNEASFKVDMQDGKVTAGGKGDTSDLTAVTKLILQKANPQFDATLTGASIDVNMPESGEGLVDFKAFFSGFLPGKDEGQIKQTLGLPGKATVAMTATADDVKLEAVPAPDLALSGKLAEVQADGQKLLAQSPADVGGGGGSGGGKWGLIALGCLVLLGVAGFLMFGGKK